MKRACTRASENSAASPVRAKPRLSHGPRRRVRDVVQRSGPDSQACESNRASTPVRLRACAHQVVLAAQAALTLVGEAACWFAAWRIHRYAAGPADAAATPAASAAAAATSASGAVANAPAVAGMSVAMGRLRDAAGRPGVQLLLGCARLRLRFDLARSRRICPLSSEPFQTRS